MFTTYNNFFENNKSNKRFNIDDMIEDNWVDYHNGITEMSDFIAQLMFTPIGKEDPIDKRIKQVRNNLVTLIKICNLQIDDTQKLSKITSWVEDAKRCDIRAATISNNNMRKSYVLFAKTNNHHVDDEVLELFFQSYAFPPLNCKWYEKLLDCQELSEVFFIVKYMDIWTKYKLGL